MCGSIDRASTGKSGGRQRAESERGERPTVGARPRKAAGVVPEARSAHQHVTGLPRAPVVPEARSPSRRRTFRVEGALRMIALPRPLSPATGAAAMHSFPFSARDPCCTSRISLKHATFSEKSWGSMWDG